MCDRCREGGGAGAWCAGSFEPYRVEVVEPIPTLSPAERRRALERAEWNLRPAPSLRHFTAALRPAPAGTA